MRTTRFLIAGACAIAALAGTSLTSEATATRGAGRAGDGRDDGSDSELRAELQANAGGAVAFASRDSGDVTFIGGSTQHPLQARDDNDHGDLQTIGRRFIDEYGTLFGVSDSHTELAELRSVTGPAGSGGAVRYRQTFRGVPVMAGEIAVQVDAAGAVVSADGEASAGLDVDTSATVPEGQAAQAGLAVTAREDGADPTTLTVSPPQLWIFDPALMGADDPLGARLVWRMDVRTAIGDVDRLVLIDAHTGAVAFHFSQREDGLNRSVCNNNNNRNLVETCTSPVRTEGGGATGNVDVDNAYDLSGVTYNFYASKFGRDSLDNAGLPLKSTVKFCTNDLNDSCPYDNAFWNGEQMVYGQFYASADDVVGHELTHGLTQYTSGLFYYADAGAINESISDVMGELIDLDNATMTIGDLPPQRWLLGEDLPIGAIRSMKNPPAFNDPDKMTSPLFHGGLSDNRGVHQNSGVNNKAAYLIADGDVFNGQTITGIGLAKTAAIYYKAENEMLTPGSDYSDLANILPQACTNLIGASVTTASDCQQVSKAVLATEMAQHPTAAGAFKTAATCNTGVQGVVQFSDDMENANGNWVSSTQGGPPGWAWDYTGDSAQSGSRSIAVPDVSAPRGIATLTGQIATPIGYGSTFLRFSQSFHTDSDTDIGAIYDGGLVEYTGDGTTWTDISTLPGTVNGYDGILDGTPSGTPSVPNLLAGKGVFGGISPNYETTRVDLSPLAGQNVRFRFRFATDNYPNLDFPGWFIDDVSIYTCTSAPSAPRAVTAIAADSAVNLSWLPPFSDGSLGISGYDITPFVGGAAQPVMSVPASTTSLKVTGLNNGTTYTFTIVAKNSMGPGPLAVSNPATAATAFVSLAPLRLLDSRSGGPTVDGQFSGIGLRPANSVTPLTVAGRAGVAANAVAVVLNVTVTEAQAPGYVTLYPCGGDPPTASNLNYVTGSTIPNLVVVKVGSSGQVCLFTQSAVHLVADVSGYFPPQSSLSSLVPARLLETRQGGSTIDGQANGVGKAALGSVTQVQVGGRAGIPADAAAAVLNVTVTEAEAPGYVTVYPCGSQPPTASNLNYVGGQTIPNAVITKIGAGGKVCIFTQSATHLVVDVNGYFPVGSSLVPLVPARLLESRATGPTIDGQSQNIGLRGANSVTEVVVAGRGGVPADATAVELNVTVTESSAPGYATVYPCGTAPPTASNLNYGFGTTIANAAITKIGTDGKVCIFTQQATHLLADVNAYFAG